mmetsp:Transcript_24717/g.49567  ORF Transcript_24717/g.49567 Transcript_24717/m.49567 type:complete len:88 (+) Transcript_24717:954-1217(+)
MEGVLNANVGFSVRLGKRRGHRNSASKTMVFAKVLALVVACAVSCVSPQDVAVPRGGLQCYLTTHFQKRKLYSTRLLILAQYNSCSS